LNIDTAELDPSILWSLGVLDNVPFKDGDGEAELLHIPPLPDLEEE